MNYKVVVVLLAWKRHQSLKKTLAALQGQTYSDFTVHVSNGDLDNVSNVDLNVKFYKSRGLDVNVTHDGNDYSCFRRFFIAREYAKQGYDVVMFLDDDIKFDRFYVQKMIAQYEPKSFKSLHTFNFIPNPTNYWQDRRRVKSTADPVTYAGVGVSMMDISIFLEDGVFNVIDPIVYQIDDLWLTYYAKHVLGWRLSYAHVPNVIIAGGDSVALYTKLKKDGDRKSYLLNKLQSEGGWVID